MNTPRTFIRVDWQELTGFQNLYAAYRKARLGKQNRQEVSQFTFELEDELWSLHEDLSARTYQPGAYRQFEIYERKARLISAAPFRDRVVHHALMNLLEPALDPHFYEGSYACRKGRGVHSAVDAYQQAAQRYAYAMKLDIRQYFPSIDHQILKAQLAQWQLGPEIDWLIGVIIDSSPASPLQSLLYTTRDDLLTPLDRKTGIPIGNLTSQFFANHYLNGFDHWVKRDLCVPAYFRYVDDLFLLADSKAELWRWHDEMGEYLREQLRLSLHERKVQLIRTEKKLDVLGYQISRSKRWLRNENGYRARQRMTSQSEAFRAKKISWRALKCSICSWLGHVSHAETLGLCRRMLSEVVF